MERKKLTKREGKKLMKLERKKARGRKNDIHYSFVKILTGSDLSIRKIPVMEIKSINPGPTIWLTACVHGDELGGIVVIQELFKKLKAHLIKGSVYAFPLMNPMGFESSSRHITLSEEDLNRSFTGNPTGSLAERIAEKIFTKITSTKPTLVLDLHNDWRKSVPYILLDPLPGKENNETYNKTISYSKKTGFPIVVCEEEVEKTLTYNLIKKSIPAITLELGESFIVNEKNVERGVAAIWNIFRDLNMVEQVEIKSEYDVPEEVKGKLLKHYQKPVSPTSGIIRFLVKPGMIIEKGQPIARIYNAFGKNLVTLNAEKKGFILGYSDSSVAYPGGEVIAIGAF